MLLPPIVPLPGVPLSNAIEMLQHWKYELERVRQPSAEESLAASQRWAPLASEVLGSTFGLVELESLIATRRHDTLLQLHAGDSHSLINGFDQRRADRSDAGVRRPTPVPEGPGRTMQRPSEVVLALRPGPGHQRLAAPGRAVGRADWKALIPTSDEVRVVIPMVVIRELDRHKHTPANNVVSRNNKEAVRDRARRTSRELVVLFARPMDVVTLHPRAVTMELFSIRSDTFLPGTPTGS